MELEKIESHLDVVQEDTLVELNKTTKNALRDLTNELIEECVVTSSAEAFVEFNENVKRPEDIDESSWDDVITSVADYVSDIIAEQLDEDDEEEDF